jgi:hypothetical protein
LQQAVRWVLRNVTILQGLPSALKREITDEIPNVSNASKYTAPKNGKYKIKNSQRMYQPR